MFGPGEYVPDPTEGIIDANDLPQPIIVPYDRNHDHSPCPRCGHLAYRHKSGQRTLHDLNRSARHWYTDTNAQAQVLGCSGKHVYESHAL